MKPQKLIGHAGELSAVLSLTLAKKDRLKLLFGGTPGIGKTELALEIANSVCGGKWGVETYLGREVTIHIVKQWRESFATSCLWGTGWKIIVVNEIDTCQRDALDQMLDLLDNLPPFRGIVGTTNQNFEQLSERFRSRFQRYPVKSPTSEQIFDLLAEVTDVPPAIAKQIATLSGGNVRQALEDSAAWENQNPAPLGPIEYQPTLAALGI